MTPLRKTSICLTLLIVLAVAGGRSPGSSQAALPSTAPASATIGTAPVATSVSSSNSFRYMDGLLLSSGRNGAAEPVLVVPSKEMDPETASRIIEDLTVMARIIERNSADNIGPPGLASMSLYRRLRVEGGEPGPAVLFSSSGRARPLYVGGYGVLFFIEVDFPLVPPPETAEKAPTQAEKDPVWAETRRSVLEPDTAQRYGRQEAPAPLSYSRERIDMLKDTLTTTMKHASNIRGLQANDWLTIVVQGPPAQMEGSAALVEGSRSVLTMRATKADVDSYAKGEVIQSQFQQRLQVISY